LESFSTTQLLFWRFLIAFVLGEILFFIFNKNEIQSSFSDAKISVIPGVALGLSLIAQTYGLIYTTATNSGFITSLYVVILPFIAFLFFRHKISLRHFLLGFLAFGGMGLMLNLNWADLSGQGSSVQILNRGDLITLMAAVTAAIQILFIGTVSKKIKNSFRYNNYQSFWTLITVLPFLIFEMMTSSMRLVPFEPSTKSIYSLLALTILVSIIAFSLQVLSQKKLSATTASMLCLLEGPFAFLFAAFFLNESLNIQQSVGVFIILFCSALTIFLDRPKDAET
jgi:drug/metabolite transporter (DMT)-like permease